MYYLIKKNQKKLLAVFGVLLMVVFIIPPAAKYGSSHYDPVVAKAGGTDIKESEMHASRDMWDVVRSRLSVPINEGFGEQRIPLAARLLPENLNLVREIDAHPELFLLLQIEARRHGLTPDPDQAHEIVASLEPDLDFAGNNPRAEAEVQAVEGLMLVRADVARLANAVKVSQPQWQHEAAQEYSAARLDVVDFRGSEFDKDVPVPTPEQLRQMFDKYKNTPPRAPDAAPPAGDPLGFGYQIPARVKLQYVEIPHAQVVEAVKGDANHRYELEVQAADYYDNHKDEFRNVPPETQPTTTPSTSGPATQPAASQPAIKPFNEVKNGIIDKLIEPDVQKRTTEIENAVKARFAADWIDIRRTDPAATQPSVAEEPANQVVTAQTTPTSKPAGDPRSFAHLEQIRNDVQKQFGVLIDLHDIAGAWQTSASLAAMPGIGNASTAPPSAEMFSMGVAFPQYALSFMERPGTSAVVPLQVWEPSQSLDDAQQNAYLFRLTAAQPPHAPPDMAPVAERVAADWRVQQAYDQAKQAAQKLLDAAKAIGLAQAARNGGIDVQSIGPFSPPGHEPIPGYPLDAVARNQLGDAADKLIKSATPQDEHPVRLVELPTAQRVAVAQLAATSLRTSRLNAQMMATAYEQQVRFRPLADDYFSYDNVVARLQYKQTQSGAKS